MKLFLKRLLLVIAYAANVCAMFALSVIAMVLSNPYPQATMIIYCGLMGALLYLNLVIKGVA